MVKLDLESGGEFQRPSLLWRITPHKQKIGWRHLELHRCTITFFFVVTTLGEDNSL